MPDKFDSLKAYKRSLTNSEDRDKYAKGYDLIFKQNGKLDRKNDREANYTKAT